eukprot:13247788-Ditylum_brightwellii.AAC.1
MSAPKHRGIVVSWWGAGAARLSLRKVTPEHNALSWWSWWGAGRAVLSSVKCLRPITKVLLHLGGVPGRLGFP